MRPVVFLLVAWTVGCSNRPTAEGEMTLADFEARRPEAPAWVRVEATLSGQSGPLQRVAVRSASGPIVSLAAYVQRTSAVGSRVREALRDGRGHALTLKLAWSRAGEGALPAGTAEGVRITGVVPGPSAPDTPGHPPYLRPPGP